MTREIKLECGNVTIKDYSSNIVVFLNDESFSYSFEGDSEFSLDDNFKSFIENEFEYQFNYHGIKKALCGKTGGNFGQYCTIKRIIIIQMN